MPRKVTQSIKEAKKFINNADSILLITGAGMSVESNIPTYRGNNGLWEKEIIINNKAYSYDEISSLKMWEEFPELAWGFKSKFYSILKETKPHLGYYKLLEKLQQINTILDKLNHQQYTYNNDKSIVLPKYISLNTKHNPHYVIYDKKTNINRKCYRMNLPNNYDLNESLQLFTKKILETE